LERGGDVKMNRLKSLNLSLGLAVLVAGCGSDAPESTPAAAAAPVEEFLDPVVVDGEHYRLELENDWLRVLRENLAGGDVGAMHSHRPRVSVYLKDAEVELTPRGGEPSTGKIVAGSAAWGEATTHVGRPLSEVENLSIELQDLSGDAIVPSDVDATVVDPEHHVVEFENDRVRVVRMTYPAGTTSPLHDHPPGFAVFLNAGALTNTPEGGEPAVLEFEAGETQWGSGGPPHTTDNTGDSDVVVLRVEMKKKPS
jgi:quercetin dioxygenase-like cupin family protein